jgi:hypothetical protein
MKRVLRISNFINALTGLREASLKRLANFVFARPPVGAFNLCGGSYVKGCAVRVN